MKKIIIKIFTLPIILNPVISIVSCTDKIEPIDNRETIASLENIKKNLQRGLNVADLLSVRNTYNDGFNIISAKVKELNKIANTEWVSSGKSTTDKLGPKNNTIQVKVSLGLESMPIDALLLNVQTELQAVIKFDLLKKDQWQPVIDLSLAKNPTIDSSSTYMEVLNYIKTTPTFNETNKYGLEISLPTDKLTEKLPSMNKITTTFILNLKTGLDKENLNIELNNIAISPLDNAALKLKNVNLKESTITSRHKNDLIMAHLNKHLQEAALTANKESVAVTLVKVIKIHREESVELDHKNDNLIKVTLKEDINNGREQVETVVLSSVNRFKNTHAYDFIEKIITTNNIIFTLKKGAIADDLENVFLNHENITKDYPYTEFITGVKIVTGSALVTDTTTDSEETREVKVRFKLGASLLSKKDYTIFYNVKENNLL